MIARAGRRVARRMTRAVTLLLAVALLIAGVAGGRALAVERILRFVSDVTVERNGDLAVAETIRVAAEQNAIRHGILRDFPTTYTRPDGSRVVVGFAVASVTLDGANARWATERLSNGVRVRIGSADTMISSGEHEFVIRYRTTRQIGYFPDRDELYWNATGTGWTFAIDVAEARITLPSAVPFTQAAFYTGPQGARGQDAAIVTRQPGLIVFRTTRSLPPRNGLTVAAAWQKGLVAPPSATDQAGWWLQDNLPAGIAGIGLAGILAFYAFAWSRVGRDPPAGTIIPLFGPPDGMSAAAVRYVEHMAFDARCFTAAIIDLGVNGHLGLTGTGAETVLSRLDGGKPIGPAESAVKSKLFTNPSIKLIQKNYLTLTQARISLQESLRKSYDGTLFVDNYGWSALGLILIIAVLAVVACLIGTTYDNDRATALNFGILVPLAPIAAAAFLIRAGWRRDSWGGLMMAVGAALIAAAAAGGLALINAARTARSIFCPALRPIFWRLSRCSASTGCRRRPSRAAPSWIASRAFANISALPRKTGSMRSILPTRRRSCSSASCRTRSRSMSRTAGRSASPPCSRRPAPARSQPPGIRAISGATIRSPSRSTLAARSRRRSHLRRALPARAAVAPRAAAPQAAEAVAAADRAGDGRPGCRLRSSRCIPVQTSVELDVLPARSVTSSREPLSQPRQ